MKKIIKNFMLVLVLLFSVCLVSCNKKDKEPEKPDVPPIVDPDPDKPVDPDPDKPVDPDPEVPTDNWPYELNKAYKFTLVHTNPAVNKTVYFTGAMAGFYLATSENAAKGVDVFCEKVEGGYKLYFTLDNVKNYLGLQKSGDGKHTNAVFGPEMNCVFTWDEKLNTMVTKLGEEVAYFGTKAEKTFTTIGGSVNPEVGVECVVTLTTPEIVEINPNDYKKVNVKECRTVEDETKVNVEGIVAKITFANGRIPNGFFLMDGTASIYVYGKEAAAEVKEGNKITVLGTKTKYMNPKEANFAEKLGYPGSIQIKDANVYANDKKTNELDTKWVTESTVKDLIDSKDYNGIIGNTYKITGLIRKEIGKGFINYYINDVDGKTGSYVYTQDNGNDFAYLDEFDGKFCEILVSVINCKCTDGAVIKRFVPITVKKTSYTYPDKDIPEFVYNFFIKESINKELQAGVKIDLVTKPTNDSVNLEGVKIEYESLNKDIITIKDNKLTTLKEGSAKINVTITYKEFTYTGELDITVNKPVDSNGKVIDAINAKDNTEVTIKGIVLSSLVNRDGFYIIDETGVIAVTTTKEALKDIHCGDEIIVKGMRIHKKKDSASPETIGQSVIADAEILGNNYGKHSYSDKLFVKDKTLSDLLNYQVSEDVTTTVFTIKAKINLIENDYFTAMKIVDPADENKELLLYSGSASQYKFLNAFAGKEVTLEVALCNWNSKGYKACVISVNDGTTKVMNEYNFNK